MNTSAHDARMIIHALCTGATLATLAVGSAMAGCETLPEAPKPHTDRTQWVLLASDAAARGLDVYSTHRMLQNGAHESVLPDWISHHTPVMAAYSAAEVGLQIYVSRKIERRHQKLAKAMTAIDIALTLPCAIRNFEVHGPELNRIPDHAHLWFGRP